MLTTMSMNHPLPPQAIASPTTNSNDDGKILEPTDTDVLLGRGVSTNRHPGNVNFRNVVSQHVNVYVTSTKKQKMMISRSIVDKVRNDLNPPGRFLEKDSSTGLWCEVSVKKALEKTAQALRDGAYPLRKQLSEDFSDPSFLAAVFDTDENMLASAKPAAAAGAASGPPTNKKGHGHRRMASAPVVQLPPVGFAFPDMDLPDPKRSKPNSPCYSPFHEPFNGMNVPMGQSLTGINFPSPTLSEEDLEFNVGTHDNRTSKNAKKQHRRNRTFGGYSCSDSNISDMPMDDIFALFMGPGTQRTDGQQQQQQQPVQQNFTTNDSSFFNTSELLQAPISSPSRQNYSQSSASAIYEQSYMNQENQGLGAAQMMNGAQNFAAQGNVVGGMPMVQDNAVAQLLVSAAASSALNSSNYQQQLVHNNAGVPYDQNFMNQSMGMPQTYAPPSSSQFQQSHQLDAGGGLQSSMNQNNVMGGILNSSPAQGVQDQQWLQQNDGAQHATTNGIMVGGVPITQDNAMPQLFATSSPGAFDQQQFQQNLGGNDVNACMPQFVSASAPPQFQENSCMQDNTMMYSPHSSPSPKLLDSAGIVFQHNSMVQNSPGTNTTQQYSIPLQSQAYVQGNIMVQNSPGAGNPQPYTLPLFQFGAPSQSPSINTGQTLSGNKRHRRHNTIAGGDCFSGRLSASPASEQLRQFNLDFLKNIHNAEGLHSMSNTPTRDEHNPELQFHDFSSMTIPDLPVQAPAPAPTMGRHRRLNTTGHVGGLDNIGLPHDWNFSLDQPTPLKTIQEEIPNIPLTHDCGSIMSSTAGTVDTSKLGLDLAPKVSHEKKPSTSSMKSFVTHPEHESNKSSLSTDDFCWHMMAGEGSDGEDEKDGRLIVDDKKLIYDWCVKDSKGEDTNDT